MNPSLETLLAEGDAVAEKLRGSMDASYMSDVVKRLTAQLRLLEKEKGELKAFIKKTGNAESCESFDPDCINCKIHAFLSSLS